MNKRKVTSRKIILINKTMQ